LDGVARRAIVTLNRAYKSWTPETVSTFAGHAVVTQTVFAVKCSTARQPRWIAAARADPPACPTRPRRAHVVLSSVSRSSGSDQRDDPDDRYHDDHFDGRKSPSAA